MLCDSNSLFFQLFQIISLLLNICLCYDLIKTIQSPFTPAASRAKFYYIFSIIVPLLIMALIIFINLLNTLGETNGCTFCLDKYPVSSEAY